MPSKYPKELSEERKAASRNKEKKRNIDINQAFSVLQSSFSSVPFITRKKKVPKVKMLRLAIKYIQHLESILNGGYVVSEGIHGKPSPICPPRPLKLEDFERVAVEEFNERNTYSNRLHEDSEYYTLMRSRSSSSSLHLHDATSPSSSSHHAPSLTPSNSPPTFPSFHPIKYEYNQ
ncbi:hnd-1 [Pristionchus pacificus]|uniref:Hnd-1 n=1 Tax=Pristionchus pacificus TaxID=54126 RepID=A0A2A6C4W9_PRIPA|nr:hnd-1 [Pristionchus pacificus]|eukprot:PDM73179.1 hnd-1 [Pristionchus pacificus]